MASAQSDVDWQSTKKTVLERNRHMFNNSDMSDIGFTCNDSDKILHAHKYVLGASSAVFHAMFYGELAEKNSVVHLSDTDEKSLEEFLRFLYTDECNLTTDNFISIMYLSKKYMVLSLTEYVKAQIARSMKPENVLSILEQAIHFEEKDIENKCWQVIEWSANEVAKLADFINIKQTILAGLLKRNKLLIPELDLFQAVMKWIDHQCSQKNLELTTENRRSVIGDAVYDLRFIAMKQEQFAKHVSNSGLLTLDELVPIYEKFNKVESPRLKWKQPERITTSDATNDEIRISRFSTFSNDSTFSDDFAFPASSNYNGSSRDYLCFSVDQCALFLGVRLFANDGDQVHFVVIGKQSKTYQVDLQINGENRNIWPGVDYIPEQKKDSIPGFDLMLKSPMFLKANEVVKMDALITGPASCYGWRGEKTVKVQGITLTFLDSDSNNTRTCVSQGQFHQIILSF